MDEVTKSVDADSREAINEVINGLKNEKTIIIVTHNASEIDADGNIVYLEHENETNKVLNLSNLSKSKIQL